MLMKERIIRDPTISFLSTRDIAIRWADLKKKKFISSAEIGLQTNDFDTVKEFSSDEGVKKSLWDGIVELMLQIGTCLKRASRHLQGFFFHQNCFYP